jgi:heme-degrading monooxygenase HmoA
MVHVLIERNIAADMLSTYEENARHALHRTHIAPGFITGDTFADVNEPNHRFVLCQWRSPQDWHRWYHSEERQELMNMIAPVLQEPEKITILDH